MLLQGCENAVQGAEHPGSAEPQMSPVLGLALLYALVPACPHEISIASECKDLILEFV